MDKTKADLIKENVFLKFELREVRSENAQLRGYLPATKLTLIKKASIFP